MLAYRGEERSGWSEPVAVTLPVPDGTAIATGLSGRRVRLAWGQTEGATRYKVRQCDRNEGAWKEHPYTESGQDDPFTKRTISNNRATISGLSDGITYTFRIGAVTENGTIWYMPVDGTAGDDPPSTPERSPGTIPCAGLRMPPTMLTYSLSDTDVALTWTASTFPDVVSQKVRRRERGGGSTWTDFTVTTDATTWTDTTAVSGRTYIYRVQAPRPKTGQAGQMSNRQVVTIP